MKKTLAILCAVALAISCFAIIGCGGGSNESPEPIPADSQYIGTWKATGAEYKGEAQDIKEVLSEDFTLVLNADGTAVMTYDEESACNWAETDKGVKLSGGDSKDLELEYVDGKLVTGIFGVNLLLEKQA